MVFNIKYIFSTAFFLLSVFYFSVCSANNLKKVSEARRLTFEQTFAEQCVKKEIRNSVNKEEDRRRFSAPCSCIAKRLATDLSAPDITKFLDEKKTTHAFSMSFDEAAYFCVQMKKIPKSPNLFGR